MAHPFDGIVVARKVEVSLTAEDRAAGAIAERDWSLDFSGADLGSVCDLAAQTLVIRLQAKFRRTSGAGFGPVADTFKVADLVARKRALEDPETREMRIKLAKLRLADPAKFAELEQILVKLLTSTDAPEPDNGDETSEGDETTE
jgi:hypothetical protein